MRFKLKEDRERILKSFCKTNCIEINNFLFLNTAFTHGSYIKENNIQNATNNERLEFFGDAILKLCISEYLMDKYENYLEGQMSKLRAFVVSEKVLGRVAHKLNLAKYLLLGKTEKRNPPVSLLADALEALIAVIYYECGWEKAKSFIINNWVEHIESADKSQDKDNFKAVLQEYLQGNNLGLPIYKTISEIGPDHNKQFEIGVYLNGKELARGFGKTKKDAGQHAAQNAIKALGKLQKGKNN